jgi:hypothetical protein
MSYIKYVTKKLRTTIIPKNPNIFRIVSKSFIRSSKTAKIAFPKMFDLTFLKDGKQHKNKVLNNII